MGNYRRAGCYSYACGLVYFLGNCFILFFFLGPYSQNLEVPRLETESELQLPGYAKATALPDPSQVCDLYKKLMAMQDP